ncbi:MAG: hypothetical protein BGO69_05265 [Bacteroidetes bacterium 46-16]|nr:MAG: hypothetical protein BGO69_05265 [Bacteroidetes bacterium 46-16]
MRTAILLLFAILLHTFCNAQPGPSGQDRQNEMPRSEKLMDRLLRMPDAMLKKDITDIGELKNMKVQLVKLTNLSDANMQFSLARFVYAYGDINSPNVKAVYTDVSAVDEMTRNFNMLQTKLFSEKSNVYSEIMFKTRDGIIGGCYWSKEGWAPYLKLADTDDSYVILGKDDFNKLMSMLDLMKSKLMPDPARKK